MRTIALVILTLVILAAPARAAETDQYMTWPIELQDSAPAMNRYLAEQLSRFIETRNRRSVKIKTQEEMAQAFFGYLFEGLHKSRIRHWCFTSDEVDRYPDNDVSPWEYQRESIYRELSFPFVLPMARTIRLGDVYLGIDKVGHFFGFGRRYYAQYLRKLGEEGVNEEQAIEAVIKRGLFQESSLVGGLVDGIFSYGDLEANYQGMLLVKQLASGQPPCFVKDSEGKWAFEGAIDIVDFITPDMDESWNNSHFTGLRRRNVLKRIAATYCDPQYREIARARFERYAQYPESLSQQIITRLLQDEGNNPQKNQSLEELCDEAAATRVAGESCVRADNAR